MTPTRLLSVAVLIGAATILADQARALPPVPSASRPHEENLSGSHLRRLIEEDWLRALVEPLSTRSDAAGGCDGVKDGKYGFHTDREPKPWWQVDLGRVVPIGRIVVYNRLDYAPGLHNADWLQIFTSDDGKQWTLRHDNQGRHFGGVRGPKPLEVVFAAPAPRARFVRLSVPSSKPIFFHLDEVEVYSPRPGARNLALHQPADQSSLSRWSTAKLTRASSYPTAACIARARRLAENLRAAGVQVDQHVRRLDELARQLGDLPGDAGNQTKKDLYLRTRWIIRGLVFSNPLLNFDKLLFVKRFTQETYPDVCLNHMPWVSRPGGDICVLSAPAGRRLFSELGDPGRGAAGEAAGKLRYLLHRALGPGHVHGMDLWWDGSRVVFGYACASSDQPPEGWLDRRESYRLRRTVEPIHLFEIGIDGRNLRQLTSGEWSDLDPTYLPNGDIAFVSERCGTSLQCNEFDKDETSCNLYVMRPDGSQIRRLSVNKDGDYLPHTLDDGTIGYTRWEYHERSWAFIQSIWSIRPDGTQADAVFKQHFVNPWSLEDARSVPASRKLVAIAAGHHTLPVGPLVLIDPRRGINTPRGISIVTPGVKPPEGGMDGVVVPEGGVADGDGYYATPWPLSDQYFLVSYTYGNKTTEPAGYGLYLVDVFGNKELIYRDSAISCFIPIPLCARPVPPILPDTTDPAADHATCSVSEIGFGCEGIAPERIRYLRIAEPIGWPYDNQHGGQRYGEDHRYPEPPGQERRNLINWTPIRILGDVPVEADGSVQFRVPPDRAVYYQLLDENRMELRRMRSFISFQPGESRACVGCHESRSMAPPCTPPFPPRQRESDSRPASAPAVPRAPAIPLAAPWGDRPISFLRDVQPVFDRHCVRCHRGLKPGGGLDFFGGLTSHDPTIAGYGYNRAFETILEKGLVARSAARAQDADITPPLAYGSLRSKLIAALSDQTHAGNLRLGEDDRLRLVMWIDANAPYHDRFVDKRPEKPAYDLPADKELAKGLFAIHARRCSSCHAAAQVTRLDWIDIHDGRESLFLKSPLAVQAGGSGKCGQAVYSDRRDPDYRAALELVETALTKLWASPRRDVQALCRTDW